MTGAEAVFLWGMLILYVISVIIYTGAFIFKREEPFKWATVIACSGMICHTLVITIRWIATDHMPVMGDYENALAGTWMIAVFFLGLQYKYRNIQKVGTIIIPFVLLMIGYGLMTPPKLEPLTPPYQSPWLVVHILFAWFAYSAFTISFGIAILYLLKERDSEKPFYEKLPTLEVLDLMCYRFIAFGFVTDSIMIVSGSIWASRLWGRYWSWDPVETWSLVSWFIYGIYLHLRLTFHWSGKRAAWFAIFALSGVIISFWGINYIGSGKHIFELMLEKASK